ncbi:o-succinylbenzoate--CoA ligase [Shewanella waksmanii]|uniref:o-succinylbenzoate--CoA ligase n=1 Tax=Shewanella waksmanii TaxID=213783 RepID=UPI003735C707
MTQALSPLHHSAQAWPQQTAAYVWQASSSAYQAISYAQLSQQVSQVKQQLMAQGVTANSRLLVIDDNSLTQVILYWACVDIGTLFCPISAKFPPAQISALSDRYDFDYCWTSSHYLSLAPQNTTAVDIDIDSSAPVHASPPVAFDWQRACNVILTSGSSGSPKGAVHCLNNHIASARGSAELIDIVARDAWLLSLPLFHIGGLAIVNRCALAGAAIVLPAGELSLVEQLDAAPITHLSLVATQLIGLLKDKPERVQQLKALLLGGGAINSELTAQLSRLGCRAYTSYGMTEMSSQITTGDASQQGSGKLLNYRQLTLVNHKIYVKGDTLFKGYLYPSDERSSHAHPWHCPVDKDGWFDTQDRGEWLDDGQLNILGRSDNMFICGGENIQPEEIEQALCCHPDIDEAIVFAIADDKFGNLPAAIIKGSINQHATLQSYLDEFLSHNLARFKRPRQYFPWPHVAQTSLKVSRKAIIAAAKQQVSC